jgi:DNA-binding response OmpR family regulator
LLNIASTRAHPIPEAPARPVVLLVEDAVDLRQVMSIFLRAHGYEPVEAGDGAGGRREIDRRHVDLVVLDLGLPDEDGLGLLRELAERVPVVVVTARGEEPDRVVGLELGADDYLVKPFSQRELVARIAAVLRRSKSAHAESVLRFGPLAIDTDAREAFLLGRPVALTRREYELLAYLASTPGRSHTREQLLGAVWSSSSDWQTPDTVGEHVYRLRRKLGLGEDRPRIATVRGVGYRFDP